MKRALKWAGLGLAGLAGIVVVVLVASYFLTEAKLKATYQIGVAPLQVTADSAAIVRGRHLVRVHSCQGCHGMDLSGTVFLDVPPFRVVATNLTPGQGGVGGVYGDMDWDRAIRHGVGHDSRPLALMPSRLYHNLADADVAAMIAYLKQLPPVDHALPTTELRLLGRPIVLMSGAVFAVESIDHEQPSPAAPAPGPTAAYGAYLASTTCVECHGTGLRGGAHPSGEGPPAPDLAVVAGWTADSFARALRTGVTPGGRRLDPAYMPWEVSYQYLTDEEIAALYAHLQTLPGQVAAGR
jgi:mono/diheme cytochrome c family protein